MTKFSLGMFYIMGYNFPEMEREMEEMERTQSLKIHCTKMA